MSSEALETTTNGLSKRYEELSGEKPDAKLINVLHSLYNEVHELLQDALGEPPTEAQITEASIQALRIVKQAVHPS